jgi:hypothetical protein
MNTYKEKRSILARQIARDLHGTAGNFGHVGQGRHGVSVTDNHVKCRFKSRLVQARKNSTGLGRQQNQLKIQSFKMLKIQK